MNMEFRKAESADLTTLRDIARDNIDKHYRDILGDEGVDQFLGSGASGRYIENNIDQCTVMYSEDEILGFAICKQDLITLLMVSTDVHRKSIGTQLLRYCEQQLFSIYDKIRLESFEGNTQGNRFYEKNQWLLSQRKADAESGVNKYIFIKRAEH
jgi:ribosomal protein S18 acetylase RimI-like enzyme